MGGALVGCEAEVEIHRQKLGEIDMSMRLCEEQCPIGGLKTFLKWFVSGWMLSSDS